MSYYGPSGTQHVYVDTSQPLYGLGTDDQSPISAQAELASTSAGGGTLLGNALAAPVSKNLALQTGVCCLGLVDKDNTYNNANLSAVATAWSNAGFFTVLKNGPSPCGQWAAYGASAPLADPRLANYTAYAYPPENVAAAYRDHTCFVVGKPSDYAANPGKYLAFIPEESGGTLKSTPPHPPVVTNPPATPVVAESSITPTKVLLVVAAALLAFSVVGGKMRSNEEYEENCWE